MRLIPRSESAGRSFSLFAAVDAVSSSSDPLGLSEAAELALLADGKRSVLIADTMGSVSGVISVGDEDLSDLGDYGLVTTRHKEVRLFDSYAPGDGRLDDGALKRKR